MELEFSDHAVIRIAERKIPVEWVERAVDVPELRVKDPIDPDIELFFLRIPEQGNRALRVVVNTHVVPWRVVSVYFDRTMEGAL